MPIFDTTPSKGSGGGQGGGTTYTAGNGIKIENDVISTKISQQPDNAIGVLDDGLYASIPKPVGIMPLIVIKTVPATPNVQITGKKGNLTVQGTTNEEGIVEISVTEFGVWEFSGFFTDKQVVATLAVNTSQVYNLDLVGILPIKVFGVKWDSTNPSTKLTRLTTTNDPYSYVNVNIEEEPVIGIGTKPGSSPFDNFFPWKGMEQYNVIDEEIKFKKGEPNFSQIDYDTVVYIPEFFYKIVTSNNIDFYFYVSDGPIFDFKKHPGSNCYVGRYMTSSGTQTVSSSINKTDITRNEARLNASNKGEQWCLYDYASWCAIWILYLVEFADWDSQSKIGLGGSESSTIPNGSTDAMIYHTGYFGPNGDAEKGYVQYRNIESPWGKMWQWLDGANLKDNSFYINVNPKTYEDVVYSGDYVLAGDMKMSDGYINKIKKSSTIDFGFFPVKFNGSSSTFIPDYAYSNGTQCMVGGGYKAGYGFGTGLFSLATNYVSSTKNNYTGARLKFIG